MTTAPQAESAPVLHTTWAGYAPLESTYRVRLHAALSDLRAGVRMRRTWTYLAVESVKNQYRRTVLGPWWITLQTAVLVLGLATIFSQILKTDLRTFLPYVAVGLLIFNLLSGMTRTASTVFTGAANSMKSTRQPLSNLVLKAITVELVQFGHNALIYLLLVIIGVVPISPRILLAIPILALIVLNGIALALWLGTTVARFRDVQPLVASVLQVLVFFTPVFYRLEDLERGSRAALVGWNPFLYLLEAARAPLIGMPLQPTFYVGAMVVTAVNLALAGIIYVRHRSRLPYWVS
jgi:lipopolysaccharide transport system permease protein